MLADFYLVLMAWICWFIVLILCLMFFPHPKSMEEQKQQQKIKRIYYPLFVLYWIVWLCGGVTITVIINNDFRRKDLIYTIVDTFFGVVGAATVAAVWIPQIYITWKRKSVGSLSIIMLMLTAPGAYLTAVLLGYVYKNPVWVWIPVSIAAVCQTVLLALCIYYSRDDIRRKCCCKGTDRVKVMEGEESDIAKGRELEEEHTRLLSADTGEE